MSIAIAFVMCAAALLLAHPRMNERRCWAALSAGLRLGLAALGALSVGFSAGQGDWAAEGFSARDWALALLLVLASLAASASALLRRSRVLRMVVGVLLGGIVCAGAWLGAQRPVLVHTPSVPRGSLRSGGDLQAAEQYAREAVLREPEDGHAAAVLSEVLRAQRELDEALDVTERFADGEYVPVLVARAAVLIDLGREPEAWPIAERAAQLVQQTEGAAALLRAVEQVQS